MQLYYEHTIFNKTYETKLHVTNKHTMSIIHLAYEVKNTKVPVVITINREMKVALLV